MKLSQSMRRKSLSAAIAASLLVGGAGLSTFSFADVGSASIEGQIEVSGAEKITLKVLNVETGYSASVPVNSDGSYSLSGLAPGKYKLVASSGDKDFSSEEVTVGLGQVAVLDITTQKAADDATIDEIVVTAKAIEDAFTSEVGVSVSPELIARLPQGNRNFLSFADLAPGVTSRANSNGDIQFRSGALRASAVNVFVDGVSQKDFVLAGGITGQDSSRGNPFPQSAIGEYKVISSNFKAEYDQLGSAAIVAATKRGTNEFKGGVFYDFTDEDFRDKTPNERTSGADKAPSEQKQWGGWSSGPIIKDKLHYLVSFERKENQDLREFNAGGPASLIDNLPQDLQDTIARNRGTFSAPFEQDLFFGKVNWNINDNHHIELSYKYRDESDLRDVGGNTAREAGVNGIVEDKRLKLTHEFRSDNIFNVFSFTDEQARRAPTPANIGVRREIVAAERPGEQGQRVINDGAARDFQNKGQDGWGIQNDFTLSGLEWNGSHTIKAGFKYKSLELSGIEINPFNPSVLFSLESHTIDVDADSTTTLTPVPFRAEYTQPVTGDVPFVTGDAERFGFYVQDTWEVNDRLTLDIGFRWDTESNDLYENYQTPAAVAAALRANPNINNPNAVAAYDINDYISTGSERSSIGGDIAPRFGFNYVLTEEHSVFGGFGRSYNRIQFDFMQLEATRERFSRFAVNFRSDTGAGTHSQPCFDPCVDFNPAFLEPGGAGLLPQGSREIFALDNDLKSPYTDMFNIGLRSDWGDWKTEVGYRRIQSRDGFVFRLGNRREGGLFYPAGSTDGAPFGESISSDFSVLLLGTNDANTNADSVYFTFEKPKGDSDWSFSFTYTWTDAEEDVRFFGPFDALDTPNGDQFGFFQSAGVSEHVIVSTFTYDLPFDVELAAKLNLASGEPFYGVQCQSFGPNICSPAQGLPPRGDFLFSEAFAIRQLDMSLTKNFELGKNLGEAYVRMDVLNLFGYDNLEAGFNRFIPPEGNPNFGAPDGRISGPTRTLKLSVGYNF